MTAVFFICNVKSPRGIVIIELGWARQVPKRTQSQEHSGFFMCVDGVQDPGRVKMALVLWVCATVSIGDGEVRFGGHHRWTLACDNRSFRCYNAGCLPQCGDFDILSWSTASSTVYLGS